MPRIRKTDCGSIFTVAAPCSIGMVRVPDLAWRVPGITASQLAGLATIERHGTMTIGDLAAVEQVQPPTMTKIVAALELQGFVERFPDPDDGRAALISATPAGRALVESSREQRLSGLSRRLEALDPEQLAALEAALPALEALAED